jgi:hypothetical protein
MQAGDLPSPAEVEEEARVVAELLKQKAEDEEGGGTAAKSIAEAQPQPRPQPQPGIVMPGGPRASGGPRGVGGGMSMNVSGGGAEPLYNPVFRAQVNKARSIRVYAAPASFHYSPIINAQKEIPAEEMWYAQVGLWIQQDVVKAIAAVNEAARKDNPNVEINVETAPVKRLERVFVYGYQTAQPVRFAAAVPETEGAPSSPGAAAQFQNEQMRKSFLGTTSNEEFDVVRYTLTVVMDQRDILKLIDALSKQNFCKCTHIGFTPAPPQEGYLYGADPVVRVTLDFEAYFARAFYAQWMPEDVKKALGAQPQ